MTELGSKRGHEMDATFQNLAKIVNLFAQF